MKRFAKRMIKRFCLPVVLPLLGRKSRLEPEAARKKLTDFSPKPGGHIIANNDLQEPLCDLQIIIPAYNAEQFLEACMESVLSQKTQYTFKVMLIDDGSTDGTAEIADRYLDHENVIVIHQENRGFSGARNRGLETLFAKYIMFVDSDDMLCEGAIEALLSEAFAHNCDIVQGGAYSLTDGEIGVCFSYSQKRMVSTAPVCCAVFRGRRYLKQSALKILSCRKGTGMKIPFLYSCSIL